MTLHRLNHRSEQKKPLSTGAKLAYAWISFLFLVALALGPLISWFPLIFFAIVAALIATMAAFVALMLHYDRP